MGVGPLLRPQDCRTANMEHQPEQGTSTKLQCPTMRSTRWAEYSKAIGLGFSKALGSQCQPQCAQDAEHGVKGNSSLVLKRTIVFLVGVPVTWYQLILSHVCVPFGMGTPDPPLYFGNMQFVLIP